MIKFRQKEFSEYDAMRQLYVELMRDSRNRNKIGIIDTSALIPVLRGNNIVIEKFTQATRVFGRDRYRMYLKIGARAKLPDSIRLPQFSYKKSLGQLNMGIQYGFKAPFNNAQDEWNKLNNPGGGNNNPSDNSPNLDTRGPNNDKRDNNDNKGQGKPNAPKEKNTRHSFVLGDPSQRLFGTKNNKKKGGGGNNDNGGGNYVQASFKPQVDFLQYEERKLLGDVISYNKIDRSLVIEFDSIQDAIRSLEILPFGLGYKIYLLNA